MTSPSAPRVLVGIATHNRAGILPRALHSALSQGYSPLRVAVIDDASTDETPRVRDAFPAIGWERLEPGQGVVKARNHLMRGFEGEYYVSLDDDAWFLGGDELEAAVAYLEAHPGVAAVAFDILSPDRAEPVGRSRPRAVSMYIGCGHVLRMSAVRAAGFYEPAPGKYGGEEKDLCLRLYDRGWEVHLLPGVHVWHEKTVLARDLPAQHRSTVCNDLSFALKRCSFPAVLLVLPYKLASHLSWSLRNRRLGPYWLGVRDFVRHMKDILGERRAVKFSTFLAFTKGRPAAHARTVRPTG